MPVWLLTKPASRRAVRRSIEESNLDFCRGRGAKLFTWVVISWLLEAIWHCLSRRVDILGELSTHFVRIQAFPSSERAIQFTFLWCCRQASLLSFPVDIYFSAALGRFSFTQVDMARDRHYFRCDKMIRRQSYLQLHLKGLQFPRIYIIRFDIFGAHFARANFPYYFTRRR